MRIQFLLATIVALLLVAVPTSFASEAPQPDKTSVIDILVDVWSQLYEAFDFGSDDKKPLDESVPDPTDTNSAGATIVSTG